MQEKNLNDKENPESKNTFLGFLLPSSGFPRRQKQRDQWLSVGRMGAFYFGGVMSNKWWLGVDVFSYKREKTPWERAKPYVLGTIVLSALIACFFLGTAHAYTDEQIVNAIYRAEGGAKATYAYGIRSIKYSSVAEARRICFNTVRNNKRRFAKQSRYTDFIEFLGSRYCPVGCNNDRGTNKYWVKNVKRFLKEA